MRNSDFEKQIAASKKIIETAKSYNIVAKDISFYVRTFRRRWYDCDEDICLAMEYFKTAPSDIQKIIAVNIINYLCEITD